MSVASETHMVIDAWGTQLGDDDRRRERERERERDREREIRDAILTLTSHAT